MMEDAVFRASASSVDITPQVGFPLGGYIMRNGVSTGVLDPIRARIGYITNEESAVVIIGFDWIYIFGGWGDSLRNKIGDALGIDPGNVILTATHTHSGPGVFRSYRTSEESTEEEYLDEVTEKVTEAAVSLSSTSRYVNMRKGKIAVGEIGANRNDPDGDFDDYIVGLTFIDDGGKIVLRLLNYGCHPTSLGPENLLFSGDFVGYGLDILDCDRGGTSIFLNGAAGDISTRFTRRGRSTDERARFGEILSEAAGWIQKASTPHLGDQISVKSRIVPVAYREIPDEKESEAIIEETVEKLKEGVAGGLSPGEIRRLESLKEGALTRLFISKLGGIEAVLGERKMEAEIELLMIGEMGLLFLPGEIMSGTAIRLKESAGYPLAVTGYANDYLGYLVDEGDEDGHGYESFVTLLSDESIKEIVKTAENLIGD